MAKNVNENTPSCVLDFKEILDELDEDGFEEETFLTSYEDFVLAVEENDWTRSEREIITRLLRRARDMAYENDVDDEELREPEQIYVVDDEDVSERESRTEETDTGYDPDVISVDELESGDVSDETNGFLTW